MKELEAIVKAYDDAIAAGKQAALATVVMVDGSSYRRAGARMLVTEDGRLTGAISGGCLEGDALRKARLAMELQKAMLVTYDTTDDDDAKFGVGLGCNGVIQILIEPINSLEPHNPIQLFRSFLSKRRAAVLLTVFCMEDRQKLQHGTCALIEDGVEVTGLVPNVLPADEVLQNAATVIANGDVSNKYYTEANGYTGFLELLVPAVSIVIVGAGNDAIPLVQMAKILGWFVTVIDGRANYNTIERFPLADRRVIARPDEISAHLKFDSWTVFMLMTHNYNYDMALLKNLLPLMVPYIGVLGPKKRLSRMLDEVNRLICPPNLYGPAGLDIGSENAEEISLAIIAEIQAVLKQRNGRSLKDKAVIHDRSNVVNGISAVS